MDVIRVRARILVIAGAADGPGSPHSSERETVRSVLHLLFAPGFSSNAPVRLAPLIGGVSALVSGAVGAFTVLRGQSCAGHALADISVTGGSGSYLIGISPLLGFAAPASWPPACWT